MDIITTSGCYLKSKFISDRFLSTRVEIRNEFYILRNECYDIEFKKRDRVNVYFENVRLFLTNHVKW